MSLAITSLAQTEDRNIVIEQKTETYRIQKGEKDNPVQVKETYRETYRCNEVRDDILITEFYDDRSSIEDVSIMVDGSKAKNIVPSYEYYNVSGIFYSDARICYFYLPLKKKGSLSEVSFSKIYNDPRYFTTVYFSESFFTEKKKVEFVVPRWAKAEIREYNFDGYKISKSVSYNEKEDADIITYNCSSLPGRKTESNAPGPTYVYPHVLVMIKSATINGVEYSYFKSLKDQYRWYRSLVDQIGDNIADIKPIAKEITRNATTDWDKIKAVYSWVQQNIRYIAFEDGIAGFKPAKAIDVYQKKYGDCKGMANLTRNLLTALGFDARLCWIGTNHIAHDYSTPSLSVDNHMICALIYQKKTYFLDATETNIGVDEYAERIQGRQVLIENGENYILDRIPAVTHEQNVEKEKRVFSIVDGTALKGSTVYVLKGESRSSLLSKIQSTKKDNLQMALTNYLSEGIQDYKISDLKTQGINGVDSVLSISYQVDYKNGVSSFGNDIYFEPDLRKELDGYIIDTTKRTQPLMLPFRMNMEAETEVSLPAGYKLSSVPADIRLQHPNIDVSISYKQLPGKFIYKKQIKIKDVFLKRVDISDWNKIISKLTEQYKEQITFSK